MGYNLADKQTDFDVVDNMQLMNDSDSFGRYLSGLTTFTNFGMDVMGINPIKDSPENFKSKVHFETTVKYVNGRYWLELPFKEKKIVPFLPTNYRLALGQMLNQFLLVASAANPADLTKRGREEMVKHPKVDHEMKEHNIKWKFIAPHAPWQSGFYEHMMSLVKSRLKKVLFREIVGVEELETVLREIQYSENTVCSVGVLCEGTISRRTLDKFIPLEIYSASDDIVTESTEDHTTILDNDVSEPRPTRQAAREAARLRLLSGIGLRIGLFFEDCKNDIVDDPERTLTVEDCDQGYKIDIDDDDYGWTLELKVESFLEERYLNRSGFESGVKAWISKVDGDEYKAFCGVCRSSLVTEISTLKRHKTSRRHTDALALQAAAPNQPSAPNEIGDSVTRAEIKLISFLAEHNISINSIDHLSSICKDIFPDSQIANQLSLKRTKATRVLGDIGKFSQKQLYDAMKQNKFSIIIDETTDISTCKSCAIVIKLFNQATGKIETKFLDLLSVYDNADKSTQTATGSTGEHLFQLINDYFVKHSIPIDNLIGFAADGASNIMGPHNSLSSRLRVVAPGVTILKCVCHSVHLCASNAAKTLPRVCEDLIRNIYTYFAHSAKRKNEFQEFQSFCDVKPHKLLHVAQTRWLSLHLAVNRVVEQWQPLKLYFSQKHLEDRLSTPSAIYVALNDPAVFMYFKFLAFILPKFTQLNLMFQKRESTIHKLYNSCNTLYKDTLRYYYKH
ncbi:uncharacterized protein LOC135198931 [Macrobrachium nipponense]|uniref:uncharacterized protein LOC135198931 n=1 Tax=Macrobrachium nipponense TaxID=159736 RepID=UPI0030C82004